MRETTGRTGGSPLDTHPADAAIGARDVRQGQVVVVVVVAGKVTAASSFFFFFFQIEMRELVLQIKLHLSIIHCETTIKRPPGGSVLSSCSIKQ